jgi:adenylate cyclase
VAILFADIVGFTHMAEQVTPQEIVEMLRAYHRRTERIVFENHGTLDKYLGDGVLATFGTPTESTEDAGNALAGARELIAEIAEWNQLRKASGFPTVRLSIGVISARSCAPISAPSGGSNMRSSATRSMLPPGWRN